MRPGIDEGPTGGAVGLRGLAQIVSDHFASDIGGSKVVEALSDCASHDVAGGCGWNHADAAPCIRRVGDVLRQISVP